MRTRAVLVLAALLTVLCGPAIARAPVAAAEPDLVAAGHPTADLRLTRDDILTRGRSWLDERVPYSQTASHTNQYGTYRQDCSGYVSMAWGLKVVRWTGNIMEVATRIDKKDLLPGDALWVHTSSHQHMGLFVRWADAARTQPVVWEERHSGTVASQQTWSAARTAEFTAIRYRNVIEGDVKTCAAVNLTHPHYPQLSTGATGDLVRTAQCLLTGAGFSTGADGPTGSFDDTTASAARQFQAKVGLGQTGVVDAHTWTALLARGSTPLVQNGSSGDAVLRVQRALNAALDAGLDADGEFGPKTTAAVKQYQSTRGLDADGVVGPNTWAALQAGK
ncbi:C40 family peptidase [Goodfellowiella coeruleoviolacea]|uniref:Peptidoglycan-binding (PGRP) domain of peptidoglycan hydrolases-containing protein n=1 Tax=Goodfellowiella coeruleoviolacea TaxID=334858 RepID=A0AAE3GGP6_9PSEU|nr:peptidoglycan-binding protein [Goodfellowiella coeruleoviolacea]MCP2167358.1 Peptidoglycan-binding (PGRP) domain of peptidoglycan hydrolases-containing protein [Goodfellowiella coeruleoviolacea]